MRARIHQSQPVSVQNRQPLARKAATMQSLCQPRVFLRYLHDLSFIDVFDVSKLIDARPFTPHHPLGRFVNLD
eukprot:6354969-Karenia_brevis.AAC.1